MSDVLRRVEELTSALEHHEAAAKQAKEDLENYLADLGRQLTSTGERHITLDEARELYWNHPRVRTGDIGLALGVPAARVHEVVGPRSTTRACDRCAAPMRVTFESRTGPDGRSYRNRCDPCQRAHEVEQRREASEYMEQLLAIDNDQLDEEQQSWLRLFQMIQRNATQSDGSQPTNSDNHAPQST